MSNFSQFIYSKYKLFLSLIIILLVVHFFLNVMVGITYQGYFVIPEPQPHQCPLGTVGIEPFPLGGVLVTDDFEGCKWDSPFSFLYALIGANPLTTLIIGLVGIFLYLFNLKRYRRNLPINNEYFIASVALIILFVIGFFIPFVGILGFWLTA